VNVSVLDETGAIEIFVDGVSKLNVQGIELRTRGDSVFRGIQAQTFFGWVQDKSENVAGRGCKLIAYVSLGMFGGLIRGHSTDWASPKDQTAWFKDWSLAIIN
jgi:hypothetical protein